MHFKTDGVFGLINQYQSKINKVISRKDCKAILSLTSRYLSADDLYGKYSIHFYSKAI